MDETEVVRAFLGALEDLDVDGALQWCAVDMVYQNVPLPPARGIEAVARQLRLMRRYGTGFEVEMTNIAADGPTVLTERVDVLRRGRWSARFWVCGTFEVRDERIVLWRDSFDWATLVASSVAGAGRAATGMLRSRLG